MFSTDQVAALSAPLNSKFVKQRAQAGRQLSYVEGWHIISEANRIFGFDGWDRETIDVRQLGEPREVQEKWRVAYYARVRITVRATDGVVVREGCGYGSGIDRDMGSAHESALKEAETDAMKRALMTFGNPFGLALYDKEQAGVVSDEQAKGTHKPRMTPAQWVERAETEILGVHTATEFSAWLQKNSAAIDALQDKDKALYNAINAKIMNRNQELQGLAA